MTAADEINGENAERGTTSTPEQAAGDQEHAAFLQNHDESVLHSLKVGVVAGTTCVCVGYPFDTIKVRLQAAAGAAGASRGRTPAGGGAGRGSSTSFTHLWKGISAPLLGVVPSWAISFTLYGAALKYLESNSIPACALAGGVAGVGYAVVMCPLEMVKVNCQVAKSEDTFAMARRLFKMGTSTEGGATATTSTPPKMIFTGETNGTKGACLQPRTSRTTNTTSTPFFSARPTILYRGFLACLARDFSQGVAYYSLAEYLNRTLEGPLGSFYAPLVSGALTGVGHCTVEYPFDVVKTQRQALLVESLEVFKLGGPLTTDRSRSELQVGRQAAPAGLLIKFSSNGENHKSSSRPRLPAVDTLMSTTTTSSNKNQNHCHDDHPLPPDNQQKSYRKILRTIYRNEGNIRATLRKGYFVSISRAVLAHSASFSVLCQLRGYL
ncbi:unnamed protein product [Amoebophrya sp. A120]|nr:unnamed protein product [Amoebophrya sp. A120]|eukprot:GSA120T00008402001.1